MKASDIANKDVLVEVAVAAVGEGLQMLSNSICRLTVIVGESHEMNDLRISRLEERVEALSDRLDMWTEDLGV